MRILRISSDTYPDVVGGLPIHVHNLSKKQIEMGIDVTVFGLGDSCEDSRPSYELKKRRSISVFGNRIMIDGYRQLIKDIKRSDVVHAHSHIFFLSNITSLLAKICGKPLLLSNHGLYSASVPHSFQKYAFLPIVGRMNFALATGILCYTHSEKNELIGMGVEGDKIRVVPNGVDTDLFKCSKYGEKKNQLLWVGRHVDGKGVKFLLQGFSTFSEKCGGYRLVLIGEGPGLENMRLLANELNISHKVEFIDFLGQDEIVEYYCQSLAFFLPSLMEGIPRSLLEAMSCGLPTVISDLPHLMSLVKDVGFVVEKTNPDDIAEVMSIIVENPTEVNQMGLMARERIIKENCWSLTVKGISDILEEMVANWSVR